MPRVTFLLDGARTENGELLPVDGQPVLFRVWGQENFRYGYYRKGRPLPFGEAGGSAYKISEVDYWLGASRVKENEGLISELFDEAVGLFASFSVAFAFQWIGRGLTENLLIDSAIIFTGSRFIAPFIKIARGKLSGRGK